MSWSSSPQNASLAGSQAVATKILVVDDQRMFGELLAHLLGDHPDLEVVGVVGDAEQALQRARADRPDVVIVDNRLPGADGVAVAARLREELPDAGLVMLTDNDDDSLLRAALSAGCAGFVHKSAPSDELVRVIRAVRDGMPALGHDVVSRLAGPGASTATRRRGLTARELEVLRLLSDGASTRNIADQLFISMNTARNHVQRVIGKLHAHSRLEAVAIARRDGLLGNTRP